MVLSIEKTNTLFISSKHKSLDTCIPTSLVMIDQNILEEVENAKLLGVFVDSTLSWKKTFSVDYAYISHLKLAFYFTIII